MNATSTLSHWAPNLAAYDVSRAHAWLVPPPGEMPKTACGMAGASAAGEFSHSYPRCSACIKLAGEAVTA